MSAAENRIRVTKNLEAISESDPQKLAPPDIGPFNFSEITPAVSQTIKLAAELQQLPLDLLCSDDLIQELVNHSKAILQWGIPARFDGADLETDHNAQLAETANHRFLR